MGNYSKFIVAVLGMGVMALKQFAGIDLGEGFTEKFMDLLITVLTAVGVWAVPNKQ